jgi:hypothetical protein
MQSQTNDLYTC